MEMVDKIIFNKLLARESIFLPNIGTLILKQYPAKLIDKKVLTPPQWRVIFSKKNDNIVSIIDLISLEMGVNSFQALEIYNKWLKSVNHGGNYVIPEVGTISQDFFTLDKSIALIINPLAGKDIVITKTKGNSLRNIAAIAAIVGLLVLGYVFWNDIIPEKEKVAEIHTIAWVDSKESNDKIVDVNVTDTTNSDSIKFISEESSSIETQQKVTNKDISKLETNNSSDKKSKVTTYYLAVGIYSTTENADEFIADLKKESDSLTLNKVPFKNNKVLVSAYSSKKFDIIEKHKKRLITRFPGIWVYREVK